MHRYLYASISRSARRIGLRILHALLILSMFLPGLAPTPAQAGGDHRSPLLASGKNNPAFSGVTGKAGAAPVELPTVRWANDAGAFLGQMGPGLVPKDAFPAILPVPQETLEAQVETGTVPETAQEAFTLDWAASAAATTLAVQPYGRHGAPGDGWAASYLLPEDSLNLNPVYTLTVGMLSGIIPGRSATMAWQTGQLAYVPGAEFVILAPSGFTWVGEGGDFDPATHTLTMTVMDADELIPWAVDPAAQGPFTFIFNLYIDGQIVATETLTVTEEGLTLLPLEGGQAAGLGEQVLVTVPNGAAAEALALRVRSAEGANRPPVTLSGQPFEILANRQSDGAPVHEFTQPITIEVHYDETTLPGDEMGLRLFYYDETDQGWKAMDSRVYTETNVLRAFSDHLTVFDTDVAGWEQTRLPGVQAFQHAGFTGAANYSLSLWTPPGPAGLQPSLSLNYSSQFVDTAISKRTQASWVGMGWSLDTGYIERNMNGSPGYSQDDTFSISVAGMDSLLLKGTDDYYHTTNENFWRIKKYNDYWMAWDKNGTQYIFGDSPETKAITDYDDSCAHGPKTWRWSLHKIVNIHQQTLTFSYKAERKDKLIACSKEEREPFYADVAVYPTRIEYPHEDGELAPYIVEFETDTEERVDFEREWDSPLENFRFYGKLRLKAVSVKRLTESGYKEIRRYNFTYASTPVIFPQVNWCKREEVCPTLTLAQVQELDRDGQSLPPTTFTYDDLHLVSGDNGYGGRVEFQYEAAPWNEVNDYAPTIDGCKQGEPTMHAYNSDTILRCDGRNLFVTGTAYQSVPAFSLRPGGVYRTYLEVLKASSEPLTAQVAIEYALPEPPEAAIIPVEGPVAIADMHIFHNYTLVPAGGTTQVWLLLSCSTECQVKNPYTTLMQSHYRVTQKTVYDAPNDTQPDVFRYRYDEPASNDWTHSEAVSTDRPYFTALSQYRGNALVQEVDPYGRVSSTFYHQDDTLTGQPDATLVMTETFHDGFEAGALNTDAWSNCNAQEPVFDRQRGDLALKMAASTPDGCVRRTPYSLEDGNAVLLQFMVDAATGDATLALASGLGPDYRRWGVHAKREGVEGAQFSLSALYFNGADDQDEVVLLPAGQLELDTWYSLLLVVDNQQFLTRVWERDNPAVTQSYRRTMTTDRSWRFEFYALNSAWLDSYSEGGLYSLGQTIHQVTPNWAVVVPPVRPSAANPRIPVPYTGLSVDWVSVADQFEYSFGGDGEWVGRRTSYRYDTFFENRTLPYPFGNQELALESVWDQGAGAWRDYRLTVSGVYANHLTPYLVGMPAYMNQYACQASYIDGACWVNVDRDNPPPGSQASLVASHWYLYDNHGVNYREMPTQGVLTQERTFLYFSGQCDGNLCFQDQVYTYDDWGNKKTVTVYSNEGTRDFLAGEKIGARPRTTTYAYEDGGYHTYQTSMNDPIGYQTRWEYDHDLGLPLKEWNPNSVLSDGSNDPTLLTQATYDGFGRLREIFRPYDVMDDPTLSVQYSDPGDLPPWVEISHKQDDLPEHDNVVHKVYNGLGQETQSQVLGAVLDGLVDGRTILVDTRYDEYGQVIEQSVPYDSQSGDHPATQTIYDPVGRLRRVIAVDGTVQARYSYGDGYEADGSAYLETCITDANSHTTCSRTDIWGRTVYVQSPEGPDVRYGYDTLDRLVRVQRGGNTTTLGYDAAGRKTAMSDPDMGQWSYRYDALGNLIEQTDGRDQRICLYYDKLNRPIGRYYPQSTAPCVGQLSEFASDPRYYGQVTRYFYDALRPDLGQYGRGYRTMMTDAFGGTAWTYDKRGRVVKQVKTIYGIGSFTTRWEYNFADAVTEMTYPDDSIMTIADTSEQVSYTYHPQGVLNAMSGNEAYVGGTTYDAAGRMQARILGGELPSLNYSYYPWTFQNGQGRLESLRAGDLLDLRYAYDPVGNISSIDDYINNHELPQSQRQAFTYDSLDRLASAAASGGYNGKGDYPLEEYVYEASSGNLTQKGNLALSYGGLPAACDNPQAAPAGPHAVTQAGGNTYCYDANGNMVQRNLVSHTGMLMTYNLAYDVENRLSGVSAPNLNVNYGYDGDGQMLKTVKNNTATVYIGNYYRGDFQAPLSNPSFEIEDPNQPEEMAEEPLPNAADFDGSLEISTEVNAPILAERSKGSEGWSEVRNADYPGTSFARSNWGTAFAHGGNIATALSNQAHSYLISAAPIGGLTSQVEYRLSAHVQGKIDPQDSYGGWALRAYFCKADVPECYVTETNGIKPNYLGWQNIAVQMESTPPEGATLSGLLTLPTGSNALRIGLYNYMTSGWVAFDDVTLTRTDNNTGVTIPNSNFQGIGGWYIYPAVNEGFPATSAGFYNWGGDGVYVTGNLADGYIESVDVNNIVPGTEYNLSAWVSGELDAADSQGGWALQISFYGPGDARLQTNVIASGEAGALSTDWTQYNGDPAKAPKDATRARVELVSSLTSGWVAFDDVLLTTGGGGNLLTGADFESSSGWNERPDPQHPATAFYRGGELVKPRDNGQTNENVYVISNLADGVLQSVKLPVTGSTLYHLSAWLRGEIGAGGSPETGRWEVRVRFFDAGENEIIEGTVTAASGGAGSLNTDWRQEGELFMTPSGAAKASVELVSHLTSGWAAFDDVALVRQLSTEKYYYAGTQRVAMEKDGNVFYLLGDHLGSTSVMVPSAGGQPTSRLYKPWGELRHSEGTSPTDYLYTGQQWHEDIGLYNYGARWYDTTLGRFAQADSIVPFAQQGVQALDRYAGMNNNPINSIDPTGHWTCGDYYDTACAEDFGELAQYANATIDGRFKKDLEDKANPVQLWVANHVEPVYRADASAWAVKRVGKAALGVSSDELALIDLGIVVGSNVQNGIITLGVSGDLAPVPTIGGRTVSQVVGETNILPGTQNAVDAPYVEAFATDMVNGKFNWNLMKDPMQFARLPDGKMVIMEGHHRFIATQMTNTPIPWDNPNAVIIRDLPFWPSSTWLNYIWR